MSLIDKYNIEEFKEIVKTSYSYSECLSNLGYHSKSGDSVNYLKKRISDLNIDISHFTSKSPIKRTEENVFIENSTAD